jgi:hypothetical protein
MSCSNCLITSAICKGCRDTVGGLKSAYVLAGSITGITYSTGIITAMSGTGTWYEYQLEKNTSSFTEVITPSLENGTVFYQQELVMVFNKLRQLVQNQLIKLAQCTELRVIVESNEGTFYLLGSEFGMALSAGSATTGLTFGDRNGYTVTLNGFENLLRFSSIIIFLFAGSCHWSTVFLLKLAINSTASLSS